MRFSPLLSILVAIGSVIATAVNSDITPAVYNGDGEEPVVLTSQSGCGSVGPLGPGHYKWYIVASCNPDLKLPSLTTARARQLMRADVSQEKQSILDLWKSTWVNFRYRGYDSNDPDDTFQVAFKKNTNTLPFVCPSVGQIRCEANFNENSDGPNYSLRVDNFRVRRMSWKVA
ncbi:hypothetical protein C8Q73DRAFT_666279 [Cubamyces lactineus]|nr:hypothetical protein C8Q73DRAFT_666279 [Cubamyces lactineus]